MDEPTDRRPPEESGAAKHVAAGGGGGRSARVTLVVSTIGRDDDLPRLLTSLSGQPVPVDVVVVDQSADQHVRDGLSDSPAMAGVPVTFAGSPEVGLSRGRNAGWAHARGDVVGFPDDNVWYAPGALSRVVAALDADPSLGGVCGRQVTADGRDSMLRWLPHPADVTRTNWHRTSISSTIFLRNAVRETVGDFDPALGAGAGTPLGAGEETDLLLRVLDAGHRLRYDPGALVYQDDPRDEPPPDFAAKMRSYGRGQGHLFRRHGLSWGLFTWLTGRKVAAALLAGVRGDRARAAAQASFVLGTVQGRLGRDRPVEPRM